MSVVGDLLATFSTALRPRARLPFPDWADANIMLRRGAQRVPWRTETTPYLREIMLKLSADDPTEEIVIIKPAQWGASEMLNAFIAYVIANRPLPMLLFQPDIDAAKRYTLARLNPILEDCRALDGLLVEAKSRDPGNTLHTKTFCDGVTLDILGGNSPAGTASKPSAVNMIDEWDRMAASVGIGTRGEGDLYELVKNRAITFTGWSKLVAASTPGDVSTSKVEPAYLASDRRRWWVPCPLCSERIVLDFDRLSWPAGEPERVLYRCQACGKTFPEAPKGEMQAAGIWIPERPERRIAGYAGNGLMSPWLTWDKIADRWDRAKGNPGKVRVFFNNILGRTYDVHGETRVEPHRLASLRMPIGVEDGHPIIPRAVRVLTAGVDVQHDRLEVGLYGWARGEECWHLDYRVLRGDPSGDQVWDDLDRYLRTEWVTEDDELVTLDAACVDTGYMAQRVYDFVRARGARAIWGTKGTAGGGKRVWPKRPTRATYRKTDVYLVGVDTAKLQLYARFKASVEAVTSGATPGPGRVHIAAHIADDEYLAGLTAEVPVTKTIHGHPRIIWDKPEHKRNEPLDCAVYGYAALHGWKAKGRRLDGGERSERRRRTKIDIPSRSSNQAKWDASPPPSPETSPAPPSGAARRQPPPPRMRKIAPSYMDRD
ncbi:MAG: phage terminase large subunit family protein [Deltaproteobacteria bacterium]|nr:phage terminase large subunit family protein [Deltaproteobacteria bacterium]